MLDTIVHNLFLKCEIPHQNMDNYLYSTLQMYYTRMYCIDARGDIKAIGQE